MRQTPEKYVLRKERIHVHMCVLVYVCVHYFMPFVGFIFVFLLLLFWFLFFAVVQIMNLMNH